MQSRGFRRVCANIKLKAPEQSLLRYIAGVSFYAFYIKYKYIDKPLKDRFDSYKSAPKNFTNMPI
jgi:hypothetical protein